MNTSETIDALVRDITGRRGLRHEWEQIDDDVILEIRAAWAGILTEHHNCTYDCSHCHEGEDDED